MGFKSNYWSCSKFANWLRGTDKPQSATMAEWKQWKESAKSFSQFRYWLAEEGLDKLQTFVRFPIDSLYVLKYYINNRWITRAHALTAHRDDIKPGEWMDLSNRFLPCLFNELVNFVEVEAAQHHVAWSKEDRKKYKAPWWSHGVFKFRTWRSAEAGIDYLKWSASLVKDEDWGLKPGDAEYGKPTPQAEQAKEIMTLYFWWKDIYKNRPDATAASGFSDLYNDGENFDSNRTSEFQKKVSKSLHDAQYIENLYEKEDTEMMIRLIKIRGSLWT